MRAHPLPAAWALALLLLLAAAARPAAAADDTSVIEMDAILPPHETLEEDEYLCTAIKLPERAMKLISVESLSEQATVHHMLMFGAPAASCLPPPPSYPPSLLPPPASCSPSAPCCSRLPYRTARPARSCPTHPPPCFAAPQAARCPPRTSPCGIAAWRRRAARAAST